MILDFCHKTSVGKPLYITGGTLVDPSQKLEAKGELLLEDGKILARGKPGELKAKAKALRAEVFDAIGLHVAPGFIDLNVHLHDAGDPKETLAAAAGGFTTIALHPVSDPVHDSAFVTTFLLRRARESSPVRVLPVGAVSVAREGKRLAELHSMAEAGAIAFSEAGRSLMDSYLMRKAMEYSKGCGRTILSYVSDAGLVGQGLMNEGYYSNRLGLRGIPPAAEEIMVHRDIVLARHTQSPLHFSSLSTSGSLAALAAAKESGLVVTAETNPHYFTLKCEEIATYDARYKCFPPLRESSDVDAVIAALADGTLDCIATNHTPVAAARKEVAFDQAAPGMVGFETALPLTLDLYRKKKLKLTRVVELLSTNPAKVLGLQNELGSLRKGTRADLAIFDLKASVSYRASISEGGAQNSPFLGRKLQGLVRCCIVNGTIISKGLRA